MSFPYIQKLIVNDCYAYQNLTIDTGVQEEGQFKHIILTGPNGSGKTTILEGIDYHIGMIRSDNRMGQRLRNLESWISNNPTHTHYQRWVDERKKMLSVALESLGVSDSHLFLHVFFRTKRKVEFKKVTTATSNEIFDEINKENIENNTIELNLNQYLVNKKISLAFDMLKSKIDKISESQYFFENFEKSLRRIFHDEHLELEFEQDNFEFYLNFSDGRQITFNQLSDGFSAFLSIIMDLLMRTDLIRKGKNNYLYDPEGFVLIDEPETHLHLSMQYEVLPLINALFPRLQLIVATHSPAVISSLKNAVVYDLGSQKTVSSDELVASSFSELMVRHFGLDNEFSNIADEILKQAGDALKAKDPARLREVLAANERYLTPSLRLELESQLILLQNRMPA